MVSVKGEIAFWYVVKTMMVRKLKVELVEAPISENAAANSAILVLAFEGLVGQLVLRSFLHS